MEHNLCSAILSMQFKCTHFRGTCSPGKPFSSLDKEEEEELLYLQETETASFLLRWGGVTLAFVVYWG